ncbi:hypothetical protein CEUSTIGMA_g2862.t1 [Chlamydomonas eustigma]|uniref:Uncharacterized protein n=1 Tax=Chlamydomonas eustigma TaxID=1157962 RepID=A0A250WX43_9CHLO|nr:hypothetical protein CEUSTIGMA_g2862.t1 [Chlamydomonas eustigma]|eukprot:GAX75418.1 hypothetical protein CEUSTIGMA_g2862.t1 [Chlamydomonas eustigma]
MINVDTFRDLLTKRHEADQKLHCPGKTATVTQDSKIKISKSKSSRGRPKKQRKVTSVSPPDVLGVKNDDLDALDTVTAAQSYKKSKEELMLQRSILLATRDDALSLVSQHQQKLEQTLKRLDQLNCEKHAQVKRLKQAIIQEGSLKRSMSCAMATPTPTLQASGPLVLAMAGPPSNPSDHGCQIKDLTQAPDETDYTSQKSSKSIPCSTSAYPVEHMRPDTMPSLTTDDMHCLNTSDDHQLRDLVQQQQGDSCVPCSLKGRHKEGSEHLGYNPKERLDFAVSSRVHAHSGEDGELLEEGEVAPSPPFDPSRPRSNTSFSEVHDLPDQTPSGRPCLPPHLKSPEGPRSPAEHMSPRSSGHLPPHMKRQGQGSVSFPQQATGRYQSSGLSEPMMSTGRGRFGSGTGRWGGGRGRSWGTHSGPPPGHRGGPSLY